MDDIEDDARYPPIPFGANNPQDRGPLHSQKHPIRNAPYPGLVDNKYGAVEDQDEEDEDLGEEEDDSDQIKTQARKDADEDGVNEDDDDTDEDEDEDGDDGGEDKQENNGKFSDDESKLHPKKRRLRSLISSYEFAPRVPAPPTTRSSSSKPFSGGRNSLTDWTERETFALLDAWGDRFLKHGRKSLRSEEWQDVAEKVSGVSKIERTDTQCRNRVDTLKKKYKKEKVKMEETGGSPSKWVYFRKMETLMSSLPQQGGGSSSGGLSCGLDSGDYVFKNHGGSGDNVKRLDEIGDSPGSSESADGEDDELNGPPLKRSNNQEVSPFRLLATSIHKFSKIYEKIEKSRRQQMVEIEKMRMEFQRELEVQKRQIMERAQAEIVKLRKGDDDENDINVGG